MSVECAVQPTRPAPRGLLTRHWVDGGVACA